jgi:hypothetical protein
MSPVAAPPRRPAEETALLNPAFIATVIHRAVGGFEREVQTGMPFALTFLVPPVALVKSVRTALPSRVDSSLATWLQANPGSRLQFAENAAALVPVVRAGLMFGIARNVLMLADDRVRAMPLPRGAAAAMSKNTKDFQDVLNRANFVGRWYAHAGTVETIMTLWGVRP